MRESSYLPEKHLAEITQKWIGTAILTGVILFPLFYFADRFITPANARQLLLYRLMGSAILIVLYYLNRRRRNLTYQYLIAMIATILASTIIELAVLLDGGQTSVYYVGIIIVAMCVIGFVPVNMPMTFLLAAIIYGIYVLPIFLTQRVTSGVFLNNNAFLITAFIVALLWRYENQKLIMNELMLREELSNDKKQLEKYSTSLEGTVAERDGALALSEKKYQALFNNATDGIAVIDAKGVIREVNERFCELHGMRRDDAIGAEYGLLETQNKTGELEQRFRKIAAGVPVLYETVHFRRSGGRIPLEISAKAVEIGGITHIQSFHRDISERKKLQERLLQTQKMESLGVLAGGIAHDFNNILTAILGHTGALRKCVRNNDFALERIMTVENASTRAGQMISKLLSFARKESLELHPVSLNSVAAEALQFLGRTLIERNVAAQLQLDRADPVINGDTIHLEQVITNLVMNAMDAMPDGGTIGISTASLELEMDEANAIHPMLRAGKHAVLRVADTGSGIAREVIDRIFDPFFTTKAPGKGTGLGLAMVYGIVKGHHGEITVESRVGKGSTFTMYIPLMPAEALVSREERKEQHAAALPGKERILIVDDEIQILAFMKDVLDAQGYQVIVTNNPVCARNLYLERSREIDLLITDIMMPVVDGFHLSRQFKVSNPKLKVIGISGFEGGNFDNARQGFDAFIKKPFDGTVLLSVIRQTLG